MPKSDRFPETFAAIRGMLQAHAKGMKVTVDEPGHYQLSSPTMTDRTGRPLFFASVQIKKTYVSYHLIPLYIDKALRESMSPSLRKRMQGLSCLNFTAIEPEQLRELAAITKKAIAGFKNLDLPWAK